MYLNLKIISVVIFLIFQLNNTHAQQSAYTFRSLILSNDPSENTNIKRYLNSFTETTNQNEISCYDDIKKYLEKGNTFNVPKITQLTQTFTELSKTIWGNGKYLYHYTLGDNETHSEYKCLEELCADTTANDFTHLFHALRTEDPSLLFSDDFGYGNFPQNYIQADYSEGINSAGGVLYASSNPYSSSSFGKILYTFEVNSNAKVLEIGKTSTDFRNDPVYKMIRVKFYSILPNCDPVKLALIILEESDVDLVYYSSGKHFTVGRYHNHNKIPVRFQNEDFKTLGWFQMVSPKSIVRLLPPLRLSKPFAEKDIIDKALRENGRLAEILDLN